MFENLEVYQKSVNFADHVIEITENFPPKYHFLVNQLNRAALSIPSNIAEGNGRFTKADRKNFFIIARASTQECVPQIEIAFRRKLISENLKNNLKKDLIVISKMISGLIQGIEKRQTK